MERQKEIIMFKINPLFEQDTGSYIYLWYHENALHQMSDWFIEVISCEILHMYLHMFYVEHFLKSATFSIG